MNTKPTTSFCVLLLSFLAVAGFASRLGAAAPPWPTIVHLLATDPCASEDGADPAAFTVIRVGPTNAPLDVQYELGGTAENGVDYQLLSGTVTIPAGAFAAPIAITPIDDFLIEGGESVIAQLVQPPFMPPGPPPYIVCWPSFGFAHLRDNDLEATNHPPRVAIANPPDGAHFEAPADILLVARASDFDGVVRTVEFFAGTNSLGIVSNRPIVLPPVSVDGSPIADPALVVDADVFPDLDVDPTTLPVPIPVNVFRLPWKDVPPGHYVLTAVATDNDGAQTRSSPIEINVLELPPRNVVAVKATDPIASEPGLTAAHLDTATFTVFRRGPTNFPLTVIYRLGGTASNGVDYQELPNTVVIPEGARSAEVVVVPLDDNLVERAEIVVLSILPPVCTAIFPPAPDCYVVGEPRAARAVILDNDTPSNQPPAVRLVRPLDGSVFLAPATIPLVAEARDFDGRVVSVEFFEGTNSLGVVSNNPAALTANRPPFALVWSNVPPGHYVLTAEATDDDGAVTQSRPVEIKVVPHTVPPVVSIVATDPEAAEVTPPGIPNPAVFQVQRRGSTEHPLLVFYDIGGTASNGVDYPLLPGRVTIPAGSNTASIVVAPLDDNRVEGTETVVLSLVLPPFAANSIVGPLDAYIIGSNDVARAAIRDNEIAPTNFPPRVAIVHPQDGDIFTAPADIRLCAAAADFDGFVRTVEFFDGTNSLGIVTNGLQLGGVNGNIILPEQIFCFAWNNVPPGGHLLSALATDNRGASSRSEPVRIRVVEIQLPPVVTIVATDPYACEGDSAVIDPAGRVDLIGPPISISNVCHFGRFTVRRNAGTNDELLVFYRLSGTASNGVDYRQLSGQVTIPRGALSANILVGPIDDHLMEGTETVVATLEPIACPAIVPPPPGCYLVGDPDRATVFIHDNEFNRPPKVEIAFPRPFEIFLAPADIEIGVVTCDPDGYVPHLDFYAGTNLIGSQDMLFIIPPPPGQVQKFSMTWSNVPPGEYLLTAVATDDRGGMTRSDRVPIRVVERPSVPVVTIEALDSVGREQSPLLAIPPDTARFVVRRVGDLSQPLTVLYRTSGSASNGVDYQKLPGAVVIPSNSPVAEIVVEPIDDLLVEGTESVLLSLVQPDCLSDALVAIPDCYLVGRPGSAAAYIRDDDAAPNQPPTVALLSPANGAVFTVPVDLRLVAAADDRDGWVTTVEFFDGTNSLGVVTNHPWILGDPLVRVTDVNGGILPDISPINPFMLIWSNVPPGRHVLTALATDNAGASTLSRPIEIAVVEPHDAPIVRIFTVDPIAREGTTNTAAFRVRRVGETNAPLTVTLQIRGSAGNGVDYVSVPETVTIPAGRRSARITISALDDAIREHPETVIVRVLPSPASPPAYHVGRPFIATAMILDNDCPEPGNRDLPDGSLSLRLPLNDGLPYRVEASTDLINWEPVMNGVVTEGAIKFVDGEKPTLPKRFFRVVPEYDLLDED